MHIAECSVCVTTIWFQCSQVQTIIPLTNFLQANPSPLSNSPSYPSLANFSINALKDNIFQEQTVALVLWVFFPIYK